MNFLLDTHAVIWAVEIPHLLSRRAHSIVVESRNKLVVSCISAFEIATKSRLGKLPEVESLHLEFDQALRDAGFTILPVTSSVALRAARLPGEHRDPFDRLIAATALEADIALLSKDAAMDGFGVQRIW